MSALDKVVNDFYTSENVKRCSWCDYEIGHAGNCTQELAQNELAALRERVAELEAMLYEINSMNDMANLNNAELWNVNGETQNRVDALLKSAALARLGGKDDATVDPMG